MNEKDTVKPTESSTIWFAAVVLWPFIFAHMSDDFRHHIENIFLWLFIPFIFAAAFVAIWANRWFWHQLPNFSPRRSPIHSTGLFFLIWPLLSLVIGTIWVKSPLFERFYDSHKIILLIVLVGIILGCIHKVGGCFSVLTSIASGGIAVITSFLALLVLVLLCGGSKHLLADTWSMAAIGIPYTIVVTLYDCYEKV